MSITPPYRPNVELVGCSLIASFDGIAEGQVATALPKNPDAWKSEGFVTVAALVAGPAQVDLPQSDGLVQIDAYATAGGSGGALAPWGKAWRLVEIIRAALEDESFPYGREVVLPADYAPARVLSAYILTEPEKVRNDASGYAHLTFDAAIHWTTVS